MSGISKSSSTSSRRALLPYLSSASSRLNLGAIAALGSSSSLSAFLSASSSSIFRLGSRREGRENNSKHEERPSDRAGKENTRKAHLCRNRSDDEYENVCTSGSSSSMLAAGSTKKMKLGKKLIPGGGTRSAQTGGNPGPEISAPQLSADALAAVKARFTLIPIVHADGERSDKSKTADRI